MLLIKSGLEPKVRITNEGGKVTISHYNDHGTVFMTEEYTNNETLTIDGYNVVMCNDRKIILNA